MIIRSCLLRPVVPAGNAGTQSQGGEGGVANPPWSWIPAFPAGMTGPTNGEKVARGVGFIKPEQARVPEGFPIQAFLSKAADGAPTITTLSPPNPANVRSN